MARSPKDLKPNPDLMRLAKAVAHCRKQAGMTQEDVAYEAGVSVRHFQSLEAGKLNPGYLTLLAVSMALAMPISKLLGSAEPKPRRSKAEV